MGRWGEKIGNSGKMRIEWESREEKLSAFFQIFAAFQSAVMSVVKSVCCCV